MARAKMPTRPPQPLTKAEHTFRLGGRVGRIGKQTEFIHWAGSFRQLMNAMRQTGRRNQKSTLPKNGPNGRVFHQRVSVRVGYSQAARPGQWKAHGRYIERESAQGGEGQAERPAEEKISEVLNDWQEQGDERLWKIIISPEHGRDMDLEKHARQVVEQMERDLGYRLEWRAVVHRNTDHDHIHLVIRGKDLDGKSVLLPRDYVKQGLRARARAFATAELGHRFEADIAHDQQRMITQSRFTDLDREICKRAEGEMVYANSSDLKIPKGLLLATELHLEQRLAHLEQMGLAEKVTGHSWRIKPDLEKALRAMQQSSDRQKTMERFGVLASDPKEPFQMTPWRNIETLEGRVLVHGEEDFASRGYMLFEDVNGKVHYLKHRDEVEAARRSGFLQPGSYASMRVAFVDGQAHWIIEDHGNAEEALKNPDFLEGCLKRGVNPPKHGLGGWLKQFRDKVEEARYRPEERIFSMREAHESPGYPQGYHDFTPEPGVFYMREAHPYPGYPASYGQTHPDPVISPDPQAPAGAASPEPEILFRHTFEGQHPLSYPAPAPKRTIVSREEARQEFANALWEAGLVVKGSPLMDGKLHRVPVEGGKRGNRSGSYVGHLDGFPAGYICNYKTGEETTWKATAPTQLLSAEERAEHQRRIEQQKPQAEQERAQREERIRAWSEQKWSRARMVQDHSYLQKKGVTLFDLRTDPAGNLLVPMQDITGQVWSLQRISAAGEKHYTSGGRKQGMHHLLGQIDPTKPLILAEGLATAASVQAATNLPVAAVFDSGNLLPVAQAYREQHPDLPIIFAADNDHHLPKKTLGTGKPMPNVGIKKAEEAAQAVRGFVIAPEFAESNSGTDWNDYAVQHGAAAVQAKWRDALREISRETSRTTPRDRSSSR